MRASPTLPVAARVVALLALSIAVSLVPAWRFPNFPQPAPHGYGVAIGYGLGGERELDLLGPIWYLDYNFNGPTLGQHQRLLLVDPQADLRVVARAARTNRGAWWQFGNEPNDPNQDNLTAAAYAGLYHQFYFSLKQADPAARVVPAGIANADWQWANQFREAYHSRFGRYPPVDGWNIHNYLLDSCEGALDVEAFKARITAFRNWIARNGEGDKPLFLTEYGVLYGNGCCGCPRIPQEQVVAFMQVSSRWLQESGGAAAWAWFAVDTGNRFNGDLFEEGPNITVFGEAYRELVRAAARQ